jgi:hypothetical protein
VNIEHGRVSFLETRAKTGPYGRAAPSGFEALPVSGKEADSRASASYSSRLCLTSSGKPTALTRLAGTRPAKGFPRQVSTDKSVQSASPVSRDGGFNRVLVRRHRSNPVAGQNASRQISAPRRISRLSDHAADITSQASIMSPPTEAGTQAQAVEQLRALTRRTSPTKPPELVAQPHAAGRRAEIGRGRREAEAAMGRGYTMGSRWRSWP